MLSLEFEPDFMQLINQFFHCVLDVFYTHVFRNDFFVLGEYESDLTFLFIDENLEKVHQFPRIGHKETFVSSLKYVKVSLSESDLSFDIPDNCLPESLEARRGFLLVKKLYFEEFLLDLRDLPTSFVFGLHVEDAFPFNCVRLKKINVLQRGLAVGLSERNSVLKLYLIVLVILVGLLLVKIKVRRQRGVQDFCSNLGLLLIVVSVIFIMLLSIELLELLLSLHFDFIIFVNFIIFDKSINKQSEI